MAYAKKTSYSSSRSDSRPSSGGQASSVQSSGESNADTATTHYVKVNGEYANGVFVWAEEGKFGPYIKVRVTETLQPGDYFIQQKRAK